MNYQKLLDAKIKLAEVNALTAMIIGGAILLICAALIVAGFIKDRDHDCYSDTPFVLYLIGGLGAFIGTVILCCGIYENATVLIRAEAYMANYNLVEVEK